MARNCIYSKKRLKDVICITGRKRSAAAKHCRMMETI